jgi:hypothetical protein
MIAAAAEANHARARFCSWARPGGGACSRGMGGRYPDQAFTGVIFKDDASKFPNVESLTGKVVDMTGPVHAFNGKHETILNDPAQIKTK